jgi:hypothetical protein
VSKNSIEPITKRIDRLMEGIIPIDHAGSLGQDISHNLGLQQLSDHKRRLIIRGITVGHMGFVTFKSEVDLDENSFKTPTKKIP